MQFLGKAAKFAKHIHFHYTCGLMMKNAHKLVKLKRKISHITMSVVKHAKQAFVWQDQNITDAKILLKNSETRWGLPFAGLAWPAGVFSLLPWERQIFCFFKQLKNALSTFYTTTNAFKLAVCFM